MKDLYRLGRRFGGFKTFRMLIALLFAAIAGIAAGRTVVHSVTGSVWVVDGKSMSPTFQSGSRVYTGPIAGDLHRGDIVLLNDGHKEPALKRVVGLPGETVELWRGQVFINHRLIREPYLPRHTYTFPNPKNGVCSFKLGESNYFVLGDNRLWSEDSRAYGSVMRGEIKSMVPRSETEFSEPAFAPFTTPAAGKRMIQAL